MERIQFHFTNEPMTRIELVTSSLPRKRSTPELHRRSKKSERETRFELATFSLEGWRSTNWATPAFCFSCGGSRIRTCEGVHQQIYSLPSLAAWVSPQQWEPMEGFEPPTSWLQISCSGQLSYIGNFNVGFLKIKNVFLFPKTNLGLQMYETFSYLKEFI